MTKDVLKKHAKSLNDMFKDQRARIGEVMTGLLAPKTANTATILGGLGRKKASAASASYVDAGVNHVPHMRLTPEALDRVLAYGIIDNAPKPLTFASSISPQCHFVVVAGHTVFMRSDMAVALKLTTFFVMPCPGPEGRQPNKLLGFCTKNVSRASELVVTTH